MKRLLSILLLVGTAFATNYTVKAGGGGNFTTISACMTQMSTNGTGVSDTCTVFAGTYVENVNMPAGGVALYKILNVNGSDLVQITGKVDLTSHDKIVGNCPLFPGTTTTLTCGFFITNPSSPTTSCLDFSGATNTDDFIQGNAFYACAGIPFSQNASHNTNIYVTGNTFSYMACVAGSSASGGCLNASFGTGAALSVHCDNCTVLNNDISHTSDGITEYDGLNGVIAGNRFHDNFLSECSTSGSGSNCHIDFFATEPNVQGGGYATSQLTIENNLDWNCNDTLGCHMYLMQSDPACHNFSGLCSYNRLRFNQGSHVGTAGLENDNSWLNVYGYNNTEVDVAVGLGGNGSGAIADTCTNSASNCNYVNNIYFYVNNTITNFNAIGATSGGTFGTVGHNLAWCVGGHGSGSSCPIFGHTYEVSTWEGVGETFADPLLNNPTLSCCALGDNSLQTSSPARNAGTNLTTAVGSGSGSTSLVVADAGWFQYNAGAAPGVSADTIKIGTWGSAAIAISSINYATNTITLATPATWANNAPIWLATDAIGINRATDNTAPDLGAIQYTPGGGGSTQGTAITMIGTGTTTSTGTGQSNNCGISTYPCSEDTAINGQAANVWVDLGPILKSFFVPPVFNAVALEPNSGGRMLWATDPTHPCDSTNNNSSWVTPSFSGMRAWSPQSAADVASSTYYLMVSTQPDGAIINPCVLTINRFPTFQVAARTTLNGQHFTPYGTFDRTRPHIWTGPDSTNPWLMKTIDVSNVAGGPTNLVDLSQSANCPNIQGSLTITTNGEVTENYTGTRLAYWGNQAQDAANNTWIYDTTRGCMWLNWATGDINAAAGWGMSTTTCVGCIPVGYRCTSASNLCTASHGVHRSYIDADGNTVWTENQTFTTGPVIFTIPQPGAWPNSMFTECDNSPANPLCQNHKDFIPGGYMINGAGGTVGAPNTLLADRIRPISNPNGSVSGCGSNLTGWCDLLNTKNPGTQVVGNASHDSAGAGDSALMQPFLEGAYMSGGGVNHVTYAWQQELDLVSPNFAQQHRWRMMQHHMKAQLGSCTPDLCGSATFGTGVVCAAGTCTVNTMGPHGFAATNSITAYNCNPSTLNGTGITVAAAGTTTSFTVTSGWQTGQTITGGCEFYNPLAGAQDFYATTLIQLSGDGWLYATPDNSERTNPADAGRGGNCNGSLCSQIHILVGETR